MGESEILETTGGDFPLQEYRLREGGREWTVLHTGAVLNQADENRVIVRKTNRVPYGVSLWPSSIALAHEVASRPDDFRGRASWNWAPGRACRASSPRRSGRGWSRPTTTSCRCNSAGGTASGTGSRSSIGWPTGMPGTMSGRYDWILGADILYVDTSHPSLRRIFEGSRAGSCSATPSGA